MSSGQEMRRESRLALPAQRFMVPLFFALARLGLVNNLLGIILFLLLRCRFIAGLMHGGLKT
jgi:ABC-type glycerol-3-phosphate transport system permease component